MTAPINKTPAMYHLVFFHFYTFYVVLVRQTGVCIWVVCLPNNEDEDYVNGKPRIGSNIDRVQPMKVDVDG